MIVTIRDWAWFPISEYPSNLLPVLQDKLTLLPKRTSSHQTEEIQPLRLYNVEGGNIGIPREFFIKRNSGKYEIRDERSLGIATNIEFQGSLTVDQEDAVTTFCQNGNGIIQAKPGWGKTVVAIAAWTRLKTNAVVIVDKEFLMHQWIERIKGGQDKFGFAPGSRVGIIKKDICEYGLGCDITIASLQSLLKRRETYPADMWGSFGMVISDEIHRIGAPLWSKVVPYFSARYRMGLTATPRRRDGMEPVFWGHVGDVIYESKVKKVIPKLRRIFTNFRLITTPKFDPNNASKEIQLRFLCKNPDRNRLIVGEIVKACSAGRKILVMSERRKHLEWLKEMLDVAKPSGCVVDFYVGGMKQADLDLSAKADVILSTYQMAKEALDIPTIDTLLLATPIADVEQTVGRIMRDVEGKKHPVVTDFIDAAVGRFRHLWNLRLGFYEREGIFDVRKDG